MENKDNEKVIITMERHLWEDEARAKKKYTTMKTRLVILCLVLSLTSLFSGYLIGNHYVKKGTGVSQPAKLAEIDSIFRNFWYYADEYDELSYELLEKAALGMSNFADDPYTAYMSPQRRDEFVSDINMNYVGLGVSIRSDNNEDVYIVKVYKNTPAEKAGLSAGDVFLEVDNKNVLGIGVTELQNLVLGEIGTEVTVKVRRGSEELTYTITRESFNSSVFGAVKDDYYYLTLNSFGENTYKDCRNYLDEMRDADLSKLIIDLRNNTGGYLSAVSDIAGLFLNKTDIVLREYDRSGKETVQYVTGEKYSNIKKIVILQNQYTASASEVLIMALKEQFDNTIVVGTNTYGKGVMQRTFALSDGSYIKMTTNEWKSSKNESINKVGVTPDVYVEEELALTAPYYSTGDKTFTVDDNNMIISTYQIALDYLGYEVKRTDGYFDDSFKNALKEFQSDNDMDVTGLLDENSERQITYSVRWHYQDDKDNYDIQFIKARELINE